MQIGRQRAVGGAPEHVEVARVAQHHVAVAARRRRARAAQQVLRAHATPADIHKLDIIVFFLYVRCFRVIPERFWVDR